MTTIKTLAEDNIRYLEQALALVDGLDDTLFAGPAPMNLGSPVGAHLRHCLDHYANFLAGIPGGRIDYDARQRMTELETNRTAAADKLRELITGLLAIASTDDKPLRVKMDCGNNEDESAWWSESSVRRELQFLISHTVHHYAIIKMVLTAAGCAVDKSFGIAPSTLRYHQGAAACAH